MHEINEQSDLKKIWKLTGHASDTSEHGRCTDYSIEAWRDTSYSRVGRTGIEEPQIGVCMM